MNLILLYWKQLAITALLAGAFISGWMVNGWRHDAEQVAAQTAAEKAFRLALDEVNAISGRLQTTTDELEKKRMKTVKEIFNETTKIEYRDCVLPDTGRLLYNAAAAESAAASKP